MKHTKALKVRIKDRHRPLLQQMAWSVNQVWNLGARWVSECRVPLTGATTVMVWHPDVAEPANADDPLAASPKLSAGRETPVQI